MRISDWSSDVCSSDLTANEGFGDLELLAYHCAASGDVRGGLGYAKAAGQRAMATSALDRAQTQYLRAFTAYKMLSTRSEEHTSELQSLMRISYAVFCLKKKIHTTIQRSKWTSKLSPHAYHSLIQLYT